MSYPQDYPQIPQERENFEVTVYAPDCDNFDTEGLCGPLEAISCEQTEEAIEAGGKNEITLICNQDADGKWENLRAGNILRCYVQMRTPPEITDESQIVTSVEIWRVNGNASKANRYVYSAASGGKKLKLLPGGTEVVVTFAPPSGRYRIVSPQVNGWIAPAALTYEQRRTIPETPNGIETVLPGAQIRPQLFEIQTVEPGEHDVTVYATHISYQLLLDSITYISNSGVATLQGTARDLLHYADDPADGRFAAYSDIADTRVGVRWSNTNIVKAYFDPESGLVAKWPCEVLRDNFDFYFLSSVGMDRGVRVEPGKNLGGVHVSEDIQQLYTYIKPVGKNRDGSDLLLPEIYVTSPYAEQFPYKRIYPLQCSGCEVGKNGTQAQVLAEMRRQAQALLDGGIDLPNVSLQADIAQIDGITGMEIMAQLEPMLIYDYIRILTPQYHALVYNRVMRRKWDCLHGRLTAVETGMVEDLSKAKFSTWQIPSVSGEKILPGTLGSGALGDEVIVARHMQAGSVNADAIAAGSVTAEKIGAGSVTTNKLAAGSVTAEKISAGAVTAAKLDADAVTAEKIAAGAVKAEHVTTGELDAKIAAVGFAKIKDVINEQMITQDGVADRYYMRKLAVDNMQAIDANIGNLVIKASNGNYYRLDVSDNSVTPTQVSVTAGEIAAGVTESGRSIIETDLTVADLSATSIKGMNALIDRITASRIEVDTLIARQEFVDTLYTGRIFGGKSIEIIAGEAEDANAKIDDLQIGTRNYIRGSRALTGAKIYADYSDMTKIAHIIRNGTVERNAELFPVGSQIVMPWKDVDDSAHNTDATAYQVEWDIVRHGMVTLQDNSTVPGMFLQMHKCSAYGVQFSHQQAFYQAASTLAAGTYRITFGVRYDSTFTAGTSGQFTLTRSLPAGGRLVLNGSKVEAWASATAAAATESVNLTVGTGGTSLGTISSNDGRSPDNLNAMYRIQYGHNRWSTSAIRQYLNAAGTGWFSSREDFDIRPNEYAKHGFMSGFNSDFLNAIRPVKVTTALNTVEGYTAATDDTFDTFFLPSLEQMNVQPQLANAEGDAFDYWKSALGSENFVPTGSGNVFDAFKIPAINNNTAQNVYLRSAYRGSSASPWGVYSSGYVSNGYATSARCLSPVCVIC